VALSCPFSPLSFEFSLFFFLFLFFCPPECLFVAVVVIRAISAVYATSIFVSFAVFVYFGVVVVVVVTPISTVFHLRSDHVICSFCCSLSVPPPPFHFISLPVIFCPFTAATVVVGVGRRLSPSLAASLFCLFLCGVHVCVCVGVVGGGRGRVCVCVRVLLSPIFAPFSLAAASVRVEDNYTHTLFFFVFPTAFLRSQKTHKEALKKEKKEKLQRKQQHR
jgi:hypothetical protein